MQTGPVLVFSLFWIAMGTYQLGRREALAERAYARTNGGISKALSMRMCLIIGRFLIVVGVAGLIWAATN